MAVLGQFARFGATGTLGFLVDAGVLYATRGFVGLYVAGLCSYVVAATFTWAVNRRWTFRKCRSSRALRLEWALFLAANLLGFGLNRGTYFALIAFVPLCHAHPVTALAAGAIAGMFVNFALSRSVVFR